VSTGEREQLRLRVGIVGHRDLRAAVAAGTEHVDRLLDRHTARRTDVERVRSDRRIVERRPGRFDEVRPCTDRVVVDRRDALGPRAVGVAA
jgi:hypothetical protein